MVDPNSSTSSLAHSVAQGSSGMELEEIKPQQSPLAHGKDLEHGRSLELKRTSTNKSHKSQVEETNYEHPLTDLSRNIVGWDSEDDPENPRNWTDKKKFSMLSLVSMITFISPLASAMFAPGISFMNKEFNNHSSELSSFVVSVFVLGWAVGPLLLSPLSEIYGRRRVLDSGNIFFVVWQIGCALAPNLGSLIAFRFLAGVGGSGCLTIGGGVISDLFAPDQRGMATAMYSLGPLFGPVVGPIAGGFLAQRAGWRWVYWVLLIAGGLITTLIFVVNEESNPHVLIARKTARLRKETGNPDLISWYDKSHPGRTPRQVLRNGLTRPLKLIARSPISALMCIYMSLIYGILYLLFTSMTLVFAQQYGWEPEITGLAYLGIGIGFFIGLAIMAVTNDRMVVTLAKRNNGVAEPEMRLPLSAGFACLIPISLFWYGWSADKATHWIVPIIGIMPFGIGMMGIFVPVQTYMIDAFVEHAASAVAALTATRSLVGAVLPLAGGPMYAKLGLGWGNSLLGFISLALVPAIWLIYKHGAQIRKNHPINLD
ncbi:major facilitator superfamily domain-containing protein [Tricharina praecox]|uniref:major facilitator superfamily domain-containing protein n=1 Tax=Tricharina praecox TaxID=43433 RepID=UPI00221E4890|nr:major facilitator superfamily domain-containing protein [Tricharina praecox]KAI5858054.1 major facilitator superfamily domain-containing protein [Tricharina praecox]